MATETKSATGKPAVHEIAGGWITEKTGTEIPMFLRLCYVVISASAVIYLILFMYGEVGHADRGPLVRQFDLVTYTNEPFMYVVAAMAAIFFVGISIYAAKKGPE